MEWIPNQLNKKMIYKYITVKLKNAKGIEILKDVAAAATKSLQLCRTLSDPMDCSLPGSSIHGIFQARVLEWVAIAFS